jgi:O-antigen ligase
MIGLLIFLVIFLLFERRWRLLGLLAVLVMSWVVNDQVAQDRYGDIVEVMYADVNPEEYQGLGSGRIAIWRVALTQFAHKPLWQILLGLGLGNHYSLQAAFFNLMSTSKVRGTGYDIHSDYLAVLCQMGPLALLAFLTLQVQAIVFGIKARAASKELWDRRFATYVISLGAVPFLTNSISNSFNSRVSPSWFLWGMVGLIFVQYRTLSSGASPTPPSVRHTSTEGGARLPQTRNTAGRVGPRD